MVAPPSDLAIVRSGAAVTGVVSVELLSPGVGSVPLVPSSAIVTVFDSWVTPAGSGVFVVTANVTDPPEPAATDPTVNVHVVPAAAPSAHDQPGVEVPAANVALAGTVSVRATPVAPLFPLLA